MNYIHLKTESHIISMISNKISKNIFVDLCTDADKKIKNIESIMKKKNMLDEADILKLQRKQTISW